MQKKFNAWQLVAQVLAVVPEILAVAEGQTETLPTIHIKSGTTVVEVVVTVSQDKPSQPTPGGTA